MVKKPSKKRGRPAVQEAVSHKQIIDAVFDLLQNKSVQDLTIEEIAKHAKVGKPTIYKWWPNKAALVLDMFQERVVPTYTIGRTATAEEAIRKQAKELVRLFNGFFGKVSADLIAEGQRDDGVMGEYRKRYVTARRNKTIEVIEHGYANGEFKRRVDPQLLIDMIYGPIYYRLLVRYLPLDQAFVDGLLDHVIAYLKS